MSPNEKTTLHEIQHTIDCVMPWFDCRKETANWIPPNDGWSIHEILEHTVLTSHFLLLLIKKGARKSLAAKSKGDVISLPQEYELIPESLAESGIFRAFTWHRPEHMDPRKNSMEGDTKANFLQQMDQCRAVVQSLEGGWGHFTKTTMTVNAIGRLDVYQYIIFLCRHAQRHCAQMEENKSTFDKRNAE